MAGIAPRQEIIMSGGGAGQIDWPIRQGIAFRVEAVAFTMDLSGAASPADVKVRFFSPTGLVIVGALVGNAQPAGSVVRYTLSASLNPCDSWADAVDRGTPDTWADVVLIEGCSVGIKNADPTTGAPVAGAVVSDALLWVEPLTFGAADDPIPQLTPLAAVDQAAAA